jgi:DNA mismatch endonuclease Vsr
MTDIYSKGKRSEIMSHVKNRGTQPEEKFADLLRTLRVRYRRNVKSLPGEPDFVVSSVKTIIFVHGCFWHNHKNCNRAKLIGVSGNERLIVIKVVTGKLHAYLENKVGMLLLFGSVNFANLTVF